MQRGNKVAALCVLLQARGQFKVRALTRDPGKHRELAEEVAEADLDRPERLKAALSCLVSTVEDGELGPKFVGRKDELRTGQQRCKNSHECSGERRRVLVFLPS